MASFWNNDHVLTPVADDLIERLIPASGDTASQTAEILRAMLKLHHDYFNNGFGNEMSQPIAFIELFYMPIATKEFRTAFESIKEMAMHPWNRINLDDDFNLVMAEIILHVKLRDDANDLVPFHKSMWEMVRTPIRYPADEEEEDYYA